MGGRRRHDWDPFARDHFFGPEPACADPAPDHAATIAACRHALIQTHHEAVAAVAANEVSRPFLEHLTALKIADEPPPDAPMRIVLLGRTMAGKSTLLAALTGGSADRIGDGRQRYSRDVFGAPAIDLHDVEIIDTPGVGAKDGAKDRQRAMAEVAAADLVLWVASNDSFQEETAQSLREVALQGKPIVVALNCRENLADELGREDFLLSPDRAFEQHEGHFSTIGSHLTAAAVRPVAEVMLHAQAAHLARAGNNPDIDLWQASRVEALLAVLQHEARQHRAARRLLRQTDAVRTQAETLKEALSVVELATRETIEIARGAREDQARRTARKIDACEQRMRDDVVRLLGQRRGWHQTITDFGPEVVDLWSREQADLTAQLDDALQRALNELKQGLEATAEDVKSEWSNAVRPHVSVTGMHDFRGMWKRRAAGMVVGAGGGLLAMKLGALAGGAVAGPPGMVAGAAVTLIISFAIRPLRRALQSLFLSKGEIMERNRERLRTEIEEVLDGLEKQVLTEASATIAKIRNDLTAAQGEAAVAERTARDVADLLAQQRQAVATVTATLDLDAIRCLLRADGRPRLAAAVVKVTRSPGICSLVEVQDERLAEGWLFPPSSPEVLAFGRAPSTALRGAHATAYLLSLTEEVPVSIRCGTDETVLTTKAPAPQTVVEAFQRPCPTTSAHP